MKIEQMNTEIYLLRGDWNELHNLLFEAILGKMERIKIFEETNKEKYRKEIERLLKELNDLEKLNKSLVDLPF